MRRRTLEEKLEAIRLVEAGNSPRSVSDRLHIGHHQIYEWLYIYKEKGVSGLENKRICKKNQYSFEKKCEIIREYQESELTLPEISSKHGIASSTLVGWLSKFNKGGKDALAIKQPSPREQSKSIMKRLPKEECEKENERLRKENALVRVSEDFYRPTDVVNLWGDPSKAKAELGWNPQTTSFEDLVAIMVKHDMEKVAADHVTSVMLTNLAEYLEKGVVK